MSFYDLIKDGHNLLSGMSGGYDSFQEKACEARKELPAVEKHANTLLVLATIAGLGIISYMLSLSLLGLVLMISWSYVAFACAVFVGIQVILGSVLGKRDNLRRTIKVADQVKELKDKMTIGDMNFSKWFNK